MIKLLLTFLILCSACHYIANEGAKDYISASNQQLKSGQLREAYRIATEGVNKYPESSELRKIRGQVWMRSGNYDKAKAELYEAIRLNQFDLEAVYFKAQCLLNLEKFDQALIDIDYCLSRYPDDYEFLKLKGEILLFMENYQEAERCYRKLVSLNEHDYPSKLFLGMCQFFLGKHEEALANLDKLVSEIESAEAHLLIAECWYQISEPDSTCHHVQLARQIDSDIKVNEHLVDCLLSQ